MRRENVFLVAGRQGNADGDPRGEVLNHVVCGVDEESMRAYVAQVLPGFVVLSAINLLSLEQSVKKVKAVLAGEDASWLVFVEPGL